jgi:O-antigen/teichoic acid export membrane protein
MDNFITREENDFKNIFNRFKKRDFSGNTGQAIKNSSYQLTSNIVMKAGSLIFTIIVARMLMPELFGLYSLALSTIVLFSAFSDFGIGTTLLTFIAKSLGQGNKEKAKGYFKKLLKWKYRLLIGCSLVLLISAYFISNYYYQKPLFYALLVGALYIPAIGLLSFLESAFRATNNFKTPLFKDIIFQVLRLTLVPLGILFLIKTNLSEGIIVSGVIMLLSACYLIALLFLVIHSKRKLSFLKSKTKELSQSETKDLKKFILPLTFTILSGVFFGYIDTLMLGRFVSAEYLAYYGVSFGLIGSGVAIIGFISSAIFPLFSRLEGKSLEKLFRKSRNATLLIAIFSAIITYFLAYYLIRIAYGQDYLTAVPILKFFAILVFILPFSSIYEVFLTSQKKTRVIAKILILSTILNIVLNFFAITYGLRIAGNMGAIYGACFATIISRIVYLVGILNAKRRIKLSKSF